MYEVENNYLGAKLLNILATFSNYCASELFFVHVRKGRRNVLCVTICVVRMCRNISISHRLMILTLLGMSKRISSSSLLF